MSEAVAKQNFTERDGSEKCHHVYQGNQEYLRKSVYI
jgi:hypothetical protein